MTYEIARYYDKIYSFKDYEAETKRLLRIIREHLQPEGSRLLDVACGTGLHLEFLKAHFQVEGLDLSQGMLDVARRRLSDVPLHRADMTDFDLGREFDVVTCLFSSIGYVKTLDGLHRAVGSMAHHLAPGGLLIIEPWFVPEDWHPNTVHALFIDEPELKIARVNTSMVEGWVSIFDLHYLIGTPAGTEHILEHHEMGLFTMDDMQSALADFGLEASYDEEGLTGRGLYIGRRPL